MRAGARRMNNEGLKHLCRKLATPAIAMPFPYPATHLQQVGERGAAPGGRQAGDETARRVERP